MFVISSSLQSCDWADIEGLMGQLDRCGIHANSVLLSKLSR